ncbi:MAG: class II fructose-bisphosphate aldolase, partial [Minisyncoccia bacterium]
MNLKELILKANQNFEVIWHFNVSELAMIFGIFDAAFNLKKPVILGVSEGERNFLRIKTIVNLVKSLRQNYNFPIFLNAD